MILIRKEDHFLIDTSTDPSKKDSDILMQEFDALIDLLEFDEDEEFIKSIAANYLIRIAAEIVARKMISPDVLQGMILSDDFAQMLSKYGQEIKSYVNDNGELVHRLNKNKG